MSEMNDHIPSSGSLPDGYKEVLSWKVTESSARMIIMQIAGVVLLIFFGVVFSKIAIAIGNLPAEGSYGLREMGLVLVGVLLTFVLHELMHGFVMRAFGAKPSYGIIWKGLMLYATSPGYAYHRNNYVVIALAPFMIISTAVILGMLLLQGTLWVALLAICGVLNAGGAVGDLWMTGIVLRYPTAAYIMDERDGIRVFLSKP